MNEREKRAEIMTSEEYREQNFKGKDIMEENEEEINKRKQIENVWLENILKEVK